MAKGKYHEWIEPDGLLKLETDDALMMPGTYSGKAERRRGAIVQRHREVIK
jgi:hypothetical protein